MSRGCCMARQHRHQIRALAHRARSLCTTRQGLPSDAPLACRASSNGRDRARSPPLRQRRLPGRPAIVASGAERPQLCLADGSVKWRQRRREGGDGAGGSGRSCGSSLRLCDGACRECHGGCCIARQTPTPDPSRVVLTMLFMYSTAGLGLWRAIVVLPRFWGVRSRRSLPPSLPNASPSRIGAAGAQRPRAESRQPSSKRSSTAKIEDPR